MVHATIQYKRELIVASLSRNEPHERVEALPSKYFEALERSPDVMDGLTVFRGTRVPARAVFDYLVVNDTLATFLEDFPSVRREQVVAILELVRELLPA
jgi:uncharacterized protein (DUF433 family)